MEPQHLVLAEAVAQAERVPRLHRTVANDLRRKFSAAVHAVRRSNRHVLVIEHCAGRVEPVDSHSAPLLEHHRVPRAPLSKPKSSGSTVAIPLSSYGASRG